MDTWENDKLVSKYSKHISTHKYSYIYIIHITIS